MKRLVMVMAAAAFLAVGCGGDDDNGSAGGGDDGAVTVQLGEQNGSGQSGTATLTAEGDSTRVEIDIENGTSEPQPAHVHEGSCENLTPQPKYALQNVVDGKSTSTVSATLDELKSTAYAINVHKSAAEVETYVSCGAIGEGDGAASNGSEGY